MKIDFTAEYQECGNSLEVTSTCGFEDEINISVEPCLECRRKALASLVGALEVPLHHMEDILSGADS